MNVGEYGIPFLLNVQFDISLQTSLSLTVTRPDGTFFIRTNPQVSVGMTDVQTTFGRFQALHYSSYTVQLGDLNQVGRYTARLTYDDAGGKHLISTEAPFTVNP